MVDIMRESYDFLICGDRYIGKYQISRVWSGAPFSRYKKLRHSPDFSKTAIRYSAMTIAIQNWWAPDDDETFESTGMYRTLKRGMQAGIIMADATEGVDAFFNSNGSGYKLEPLPDQHN